MSLLRLAPIPTTFVLLAVLNWTVPVSVPAGPEVAAARAAIAASLESAPYLVAGRLVGQDQDLPTEAMKLLKPNAVLSRYYRDVARDRSYGFVMVHATDLNDMVGHYPPICYPSSGFTDVSDDVLHRLDLGFAEVSVREYRFARTTRSNDEVEVRVFSGFILPDGSTTTEMRELRERAGRRSLAAAGAAQFQMIVPEGYDVDEAIEAMTAIVRSTEPTLRLMGLGASDEREGAAP